MAFWNKQRKQKKETSPPKVIDVSIQDIRKAISSFAEDKRDGISLKILVLEDNLVDHSLLTSYLGGIPSEHFYMSKETFELFESKDKHIPFWIDKMQRAVDTYIRTEEELPIIEGDPYQKISFYKLEKKAMLQERPPIEFYLSEQEQMVSHRKPEK
ncbi:DUF3939 domain-containing protein [Bacillus sp. NTK071]|uniref:DUF3939 domain-containing protein n=1 Tax=Bacillus sp. NTK071 TaxID=2802175 RepID=UPI001A8C6414|nr:DUF3939 domain-containing protein [Bacillus sp. NTK071]MBN8208603.1 DUF3939 domain-containing protein [Bacillus sp. NTK071]